MNPYVVQPQNILILQIDFFEPDTFNQEIINTLTTDLISS